jgi:alpha-L-fucosidase
MSTEEQIEALKDLKRIVEERENMKDKITICEWCGLTYPKNGWKYYKIHVRNMSIEKVIENIEKGTKDNDFEKHIICSDCYERLKECEEC